MIKPEDTIITTLGEPKYPSPLREKEWSAGGAPFISDKAKARYQAEIGVARERPADVFFEIAGPRAMIFFKPQETKAAIVTCGGVSPGLNNVIRSATHAWTMNYGVREVYGIRYGYQGLNPAVGEPPVLLNIDKVDGINEDGGTVLGTSRGKVEAGVMVDFLQKEKINILLCIGGDGTQRGAHEIFSEAQRRKIPLAVIGIPKTIDNDIPFVSRTFGFTTALEKAKEILDGAHTEATSVFNGIGLVKLMGRSSGFIACGATLANQNVNFTLIPEVPFKLEGKNGFLEALRKRLLARRHAVIVVAEGAGQEFLGELRKETDASGNRLFKDIGEYLRQKIITYFREQNIPVGMKYFDPSYIIRSVPADCADSILCDQLARMAVHAGMAGKTGLLIGLTNNIRVHVPIATVVKEKKRVYPDGDLWLSVLAATNQPPVFR
ncbi:MAG: ATP-dependent 6-phosphofructokinase [Kiritimatiellia bacterium]|nr:ATP-dependent 6-phosphofructokinase [Kiritimatiellia bacterium]